MVPARTACAVSGLPSRAPALGKIKGVALTQGFGVKVFSQGVSVIDFGVQDLKKGVRVFVGSGSFSVEVAVSVGAMLGVDLVP